MEPDPPESPGAVPHVGHSRGPRIGEALRGERDAARLRRGSESVTIAITLTRGCDRNAAVGARRKGGRPRVVGGVRLGRCGASSCAGTRTVDTSASSRSSRPDRRALDRLAGPGTGDGLRDAIGIATSMIRLSPT